MRPSLEIERANTSRENGTSDGNRILITVISQAATETIKNRLGILSGPLIKINYSICILSIDTLDTSIPQFKRFEKLGVDGQ